LVLTVDGIADGPADADGLSDFDNLILGRDEGTVEGTSVGTVDGIADGPADADGLSDFGNLILGRDEGTVEGTSVGPGDGIADGPSDAIAVGADDVGDNVGYNVGAVVPTTPPFFDDLPPFLLLVVDGVGDVVALPALPALPFFKNRVAAVPSSTTFEDAAAGAVMIEKSVIMTTRNSLLVYNIILIWIF
jgi:hypothetical protein